MVDPDLTTKMTYFVVLADLLKKTTLAVLKTTIIHF